jgi:hypothetical protein
MMRAVVRMGNPKSGLGGMRNAYQCGCYNSRPAAGEFTVTDDELVDRGIDGGFIY